MVRGNKKIGPGSLSLLFCIIGLLFAVSFRNYGCFGDYVLKHMGLSPWSRGNQGIHYTIFYASIFYIVSLILGFKFRDNFGAKAGRILSILLLISILFFSLFCFKVTSG